MPDRGDHGHGTRDDGADEPLVAERQQIFEAASSAREHDHVDRGFSRDGLESMRDLRRRVGALHARLGDQQPRGRKAGGDGCDHVAFRRRVVAGDEPDPPRKSRQRALALGGEQPFGGELLLQPFERCEMGAEAEALDREHL